MQRSSELELEVEAGPAPLLEPLFHLVAGRRPFGADLGERQVALGQLGPAAVHAVEDVDHEVDRLVGAGHLLDVQVDVLNALERRQPVHVDLGRLAVLETDEAIEEARDALLHQRRHVDPKRIVLHLERAVEGELLAIEVEVQPGERLRVAVEELRRPAANDAVERGHPLLPVEQQLDHAGRDRTVAARVRVLRARGPDQEAADRIAPVKRLHQRAHLVAVPDVAALELGERDAAEVDLGENVADFHAECRFWGGCRPFA